MKGHDSITCRELIEFLGDYLEGVLPQEVVLTIELHLKVCPSCVAYIESYRRTVKLSKEAMRGGAIEGTVPEGVLRAVREARRAQLPRDTNCK